MVKESPQKDKDYRGYDIDNLGSINLVSGATIDEFSVDGTLAGDSDTAVPTEKAVKKYVDDNIGGGFPEGTSVKSTGETGAVKYLREDGDGTCSWQTPSGSGDMTKVVYDSDDDGTVDSADTSAALTGSQASDIVANNSKVGITPTQASDIVANTAKISFDSTSSTRLANTSGTNTGDMSNSDVKTAYEANADTNEFSDAEQTKLASIEALAEVNASTDHASTLLGATVLDDTDIANGKTLVYNSTSGKIEWETPSSGVTDHTLLSNIGTNAHTVIDSHIADSTLHFTEASISITGSQVSDFQTVVSANADVSASKVITDWISVSQVVNLDTMESDIATNNSKVSNVSTDLSEGTITTTTVDVDSSDGTNATLVSASTTRAGVLTKAKFDEIVANTAKVSNATHTGDVTGSTALTIAVDAVDIPMLSATGTASGTTFLRGDNTWATPSSSGSPLTTKGDLFTYSTVDARLPVGINDQVLTADSTQSTGVKWATPSAGGGTGSVVYERKIEGEAYTTTFLPIVIPDELDATDVKEVRLILGGLPTGQALKVDVRKNGTATTDSIFTSDVEIEVGTAQSATNGVYMTACGTASRVGTPGTTLDSARDTVASDDVLWVVITQVGSTLAGADLIVQVTLQ